VNWELLGYYTASRGNSLTDVWRQPIGFIFVGEESPPKKTLILEDETDRLSRNVGKELSLLGA